MSRYHNRKETKRIGQKIKELRVAKGWNIEDIAEMTGFSRSTITAIEKGAETDTTHLIEISKAIGVEPKQIFELPFEIKPRFKLSAKRKDQNKLTLKLRSFVENGFFKEPRIVSDVRGHLLSQHRLKIGSAQISVVLLRLKNEGIIKSTKRGRKNFYIGG